MNPQKFVSKWYSAEFKERSFYQEHFIDLAHQKLDRTVLVAYGWPTDLSAGSGLGNSAE